MSHYYDPRQQVWSPNDVFCCRTVAMDSLLHGDTAGILNETSRAIPNSLEDIAVT
jgi:hypothetical protein